MLCDMTDGYEQLRISVEFGARYTGAHWVGCPMGGYEQSTLLLALTSPNELTAYFPAHVWWLDRSCAGASAAELGGDGGPQRRSHDLEGATRTTRRNAELSMR